MAENDALKDNLAFEQKKKFEDEIKETIKELKTGETTTIGGMEITNYGGQATIKLEGIDITFGIVDKDGNFTYNRENFVEVKKVLEEEGITLEELGLPDIEEWIDLEDQQREENTGAERGESKEKGGEEKPKIEEPEEEKQKDDEEKKLVKKEYPKKDSSWIEIKSDRETDEMRTFSTMLKKEYPNHMQGAERFFIAPNPKDANDYNLYVADARGNVINEIPLEHTEGKNPMDEDILTYGKDGNDAKSKQAVQILKIGNSVNGAMLVITGGTRTGTQVHIGNRSRGDDYNAHTISSSLSQKEIMDANESVRKGTSSSYGEREQGTRERKYYETLQKLEKQGVPDGNNPAKDGISTEEIEVDSINDLSASLAAIFAKEYGLSKDCAMFVAKEVVEGGKEFDDSLREGILQEEKEKEAKGTIPPGSAERLAEGRYEAALNGDIEEQREEEQEKMPGQKRGM